MKKALLGLAVLASLVAVPAQAAQFWYDTMQEYPGGAITTNTSLWFDHLPGSLTFKDLLVVTNTYTSGAAVDGQRLRVNGLNSEYAMRLFDPIYTNSVNSGPVYASFIVNANYVPAAGQGSYFTTFNGVYPNPPDGTSATNSFQYRGHVFEIGCTNGYSAPFSYVIGVANNQSETSTPPGPNVVVPIDLAKNVDYQVVLKYDIDNAVAYVWVNPASEGDTANMAGPTSDLGSITNGLGGLLFRQRSGGTMDIRDVVVGDTFADVMTNSAATSPVLVATNFNVVSNYSGNSAMLEVFATSIGGGVLSYQWYQITSGGVTNPVSGSGQKYIKSNLTGSDAGNYFCAVTNVGGQGALSSTNFQILVNTTMAAPTASITNIAPRTSIGQKITLACAAAGTGPLSYTWKFNGNVISDGDNPFGFPGDNVTISGSQTTNLTLDNVSLNEAGSYSVTVHGGVAPDAVSTVALTVANPLPVSIAYLRSLLDTTSWLPTDMTTLFSVRGVITCYTNFIAENTAQFSYYIQDDTAGINFFGYVASGDPAFRPQLGDIVTTVGHLNYYNNNLELECEADNDPYQTYAVVGHTNTLPAPFVFTPSLTNNTPLMETNIEGRLIMLTNVFFPTNDTIGLGGNKSWFVTNSGTVFLLNFPGGSDQDIRNRTMPSFAWTVTGPCVQFRSGAYTNVGYQLNVSRFADIVSAQPPQPSVNGTVSGNNVVLKWAAVPYDISLGGGGGYAYSVLAADNLSKNILDYHAIASGLAFNTTNGTYTVTNALQGARQYYRISSP